MNRIYFDNASTSFPKAPGVGEAMARFIQEVGCNVGRSSYAEAYSATEAVMETRGRLARLLGAAEDNQVIFTANVTQSLNMLLKGLLGPGDHVLTSSMEHNAVMRPLAQLMEEGVEVSHIPCDGEGTLDLDAMKGLLRPNTRALVLLHASNVCGAMLPAAQAGRFAREHGLVFILDAAQTAGAFPLDMEAMGVDALAFTGHKSLLGPQGIGGFAVTRALAKRLRPLLSGGTGSRSDSEQVPPFLPDRFEAGTLNLPGIYGLGRALEYLEETGIDAIRTRELALAKSLWEGLEKLPGLRLVGSRDWERRAPIVSADAPGQDNAQIAWRLSEEYGILTRCGLHCAPRAHKSLGTFPQGTIRFSLSHFNTPQEVAGCVQAMGEILR